jgi:hypothetical protein
MDRRNKARTNQGTCTSSQTSERKAGCGGDQPAGREPVRNFVHAGECEGRTTRKALDGKAFDAQVIGYLHDIIGPVQEPIPWSLIRASDARSIQANESHSKAFCLRLDRQHLQA